MQPITMDEIASNSRYEKSRDDRRKNIIAMKKHRRIAIGPKISLVFENKETMLFQVQEMLRIERIEDPKLIAEEIAVYNELLPEGMAIGATLLIELTQEDNIPAVLKELSGVEETVVLHIGSHIVKGEAELGRSTEEKTSAVHYLTFRFTERDREALAEDGHNTRIMTEHSAYAYDVPLPYKMTASLLHDLISQ